VKRIFQNISLLFLVSVYLLASIGVGIRECYSAGTKNVVILLSNSSCKSMHKHCTCSSHHCHKKAQSKKCCETRIHQLDHDYDLNQTNHNSQLISPVLTAYLDVENSFPELLRNSDSPEIFYSDPPPILSNSTYSFHSQWRL